MAGTEDHPVWSVYDEVRTARLNVKRLQLELRHLRRIHFSIEIVLAIASTSSISGFWFLQNYWGGAIWKTVGCVAVVITVIKPLLKLTEHIRTKQDLLTNYQVLEHDLQCLINEIKFQKKYDETLHKEFKKISLRKSELIKKGDGASISSALQKRLESEVAAEFPTGSFYIPQ